MKTRLLVLAIGVTILVVSIFGMIQSNKVATEVDYSGDIIFDTTEGYTDSKAYLLTVGGLYIRSEPPIWVSYDVTVGTDEEFPFPYNHTYHVAPPWYLIATGFGMSIGFIMGVAGLSGVLCWMRR